MIDEAEFVQANSLDESINDSMNVYFDAPDVDAESAVSVYAPGKLAGELAVPRASGMRITEVISGTHLPSERSSLLVEGETFVQKFETEHAVTSVKPVILVFSQRPAARISPADETSPIEGFEHIGEVSVRLLARWSLPKMMLAQGRRGRNPAPASAHDPWEEET
jgi:hypothetical protein